MDKNNRIKKLEERIVKLEKLIAKTNKYILYMELRGSGIDPAYNDALDLIKCREYITYHWLQSRLEIGYIRAADIMDKLESEGKIGPKIKGREKRKVIV